MTAYVIADITITNPEGYAPYRKLAGESTAKFGGKFIVRGGAVESLEGGWNPSRVVIIEFPSMEAARNWYNCPEYQEALKIRVENSTGRLIMVEGPAPG
jgi:uncharacterized protein (DUF1330 family)